MVRRCAALMAAAILMPVAACGDDGSSEGGARSIALAVGDPAPDRATMSADTDTVRAGVVEISLRNDGDGPHDAQLFRVTGDHDGVDVAEQVLGSIDGFTQPRWVRVAGGVGQLAPGESASVTQVLEPGRYVAADTQERDGGRSAAGAVRGATVEFEVVGDRGGKLPATPAEIEVTDTHIIGRRLRPGVNRLTIRNTGTEPHQVTVFPPGPGEETTGPSLDTLDESGLSWPPIDVPHTRATTSIAPGEAQVTELAFDRGSSLLASFVYDWDGGSPQALDGLFSWTVASSGPERRGAGAR